MRSPSLDSLRAVAVILVLFRHASPNPLTDGAWLAVDLFFVLSGFLVSGLLFTEYQKRGSVDVKRFLIRRGFKIYPSFWVMLGATLLVFGFDTTRNLIGELTFTQNYIGRLWNHTWSLAVEEHFYIGLALLVWYTKRFNLIPWLFLGVAIVCLLQRAWFAETHGINLFLTNFRIDSLMFGVLISYYWHFKGMRLARFRWPLLIGGISMLVPLFFFDSANNSFVFVYGLTWIYLAAGMILVAALNFEAKMLTPLAKIGMYSYSIYLWHMFVREFIDSTPLFIIISIVVGIAAGKAVEYPILKLRDKITRPRSLPRNWLKMKISRIPKRIKDDLRIIRLVKNWPAILQAKIAHAPIIDIRLRNGMRISAPPEARLNFLFHEIWIDRVYGNVKQGSTVIDIGANIGVYALFAVSQGARVFAFEPGPSAEYFRKNTKGESHISFEQKAIAGLSGTRHLNTDKDWILHRLSETGIEVECRTLDEVLEISGGCDVLKIDCEGAEYEILSNCKNLSKIRRIVGEFHYVDEVHNGQFLHTLLLNRGFKTTVDSGREGMFVADSHLVGRAAQFITVSSIEC